jgi:alkaline phosphatase isozyme conversion protein
MRRTTLTFIAVAALAAMLALGLGAVATHTSDAAQHETPVAGPSADTSAYEYMAELSDEIGSRVAGLSSETRAGDRILQWFGDLGYTPDTQEFTFTQGGDSHHSRNIVAVKPGVSGKQIVIGAHYDSVRVGRGAFDNASGVALMMQLADALRDEKTPYTLVFVAFGAEEAGLQGSAHYVAEMSEQARADTVLMINFDSVATGDRVYCYSDKDASWPQLAVRSLARSQGADFLTSPGLNGDYPYGTTGDWSDHVAFRKAGIPYLYFEATNWLLGEKDGYLNTAKDREVWHSKKDTLSYIEQRYPGRIEHQLGEEFAALAAFLTHYEVPAAQASGAATTDEAAPAEDAAAAQSESPAPVSDATREASPAAQAASPSPVQ